MGDLREVEDQAIYKVNCQTNDIFEGLREGLIKNNTVEDR
jgi:hypothetical protein